MEVGFLLLPCVCQGLNSDNQVWQCIPLPTEPSFQSCFWFLVFWSNPVRPETDCSPDWSETNSDPITLASWMLGLKSFLPWALYGSGKQLCIPHTVHCLVRRYCLLRTCWCPAWTLPDINPKLKYLGRISGRSSQAFPRVVTSLWEL